MKSIEVNAVWRARALRRRFRAYAQRGAIILLYHRVADLPTDPWSLAVSPSNFAEHLDVLQAQTHVVELRKLADIASNRTLMRRRVAITFDDGYADNLLAAKPCLERRGLAATMFLTMPPADPAAEFWWDELEAVLSQSRSHSAPLRLKVRGERFEWDAPPTTQESIQRGRERSPAPVWSSHQSDLYHALWPRFQRLDHDERRNILDELWTWSGMTPRHRPSHRRLTHAETLELSQGAYIEIGAHTVTHPALSALSVEAQRREIDGSKVGLEDVVGRPVTSFSYPFGRTLDYGAETIEVVRNAGFALACSNMAALVTKGVDQFQLPRVQVQNWDGNEFEKRLAWWFEHG